MDSSEEVSRVERGPRLAGEDEITFVRRLRKEATDPA